MSTQPTPPAAPAPVATPAVDDWTLDGEGEAQQTAEPDASTAAAVLGRKGGKAAAEARKAKAAEADKEADTGADTDDPAPQAKPKEAKAEGRDKEQDTEADTIEPEKPLGKPVINKDEKNRAVQRLDELRGELWQERNARRQLEARLAQVEKAKTAEQAPPTLKAEPQLSEYDDFEKYLADRDQYRRQEWEREQEDKHREYAAKEAATRTVGFIQGRLQKFHESQALAADGNREAFLARQSPDVLSLEPTFTLDEGERVTSRHLIADEILLSDKAAEVMQYLSDNPDDLKRIAALQGPRAIAREMARVEAKLESVTAGNPLPAANARRVSQAPPPVRPVTGVPHTASDDPDPESDDYDTWSRKVDAKERRRR